VAEVMQKKLEKLR